MTANIKRGIALTFWTALLIQTAFVLLTPGTDEAMVENVSHAFGLVFAVALVCLLVYVTYKHFSNEE